MYFSIAAPQVITLPDGTQLSFRVNPADTSLVEMHIVGVDGNDVPGTHVLTFKRNGGPNDTSFVPTNPPKEAVDKPLYADAPSVDKDAVRGDSWQTKQDMPGWDKPPAGDTFAPAGKAANAPVDTKPAA